MNSAVSIIVPTYREAPNIEPLARRIFDTLRDAQMTGELIIVDDNSQDGITDVVEKLRPEFPVQLRVRTKDRGLASAVLHGLRQAQNDILVVMDADLQHPPEAIPALVTPISSGADLVIGSRNITGAGIDATWKRRRRLNSLVATALARPLVDIRDPMSGFCALPRATLERATTLNPIGYKIVLEIAVKARVKNCVEIPIHFATRAAGDSKLSLREQWRYLKHLALLYRFKLTGR